MGQPRLDDSIVYSPEWWARFVDELTRLRTPVPARIERPARNEDPELEREAAQVRREARERRTPPPEEKTTCLLAAKEPASSDPSSSRENTEEEDLTPGELSSLAKMAADDREILERKRLLRLTPGTKPRT
jgi:hypothetical protein